MAQGQTSAAEQVSTERIHTATPATERRAKHDRTGLDPDLSWFLECGGAALGERGTLGGIVSALEHGGHPGGVPNTDLYTDEQVGWGRNVYGLVEKHRWLTAAWNALSPESQGVLLVRYMPPAAEFRSDEGFGARDRFIPVLDGAPEPVAKRTASGQFGPGNTMKREQLDRERRNRDARRTGVEALLGELAGLAFRLCADPAKLLVACRDAAPTKTNKAGLVVVDRERQTQRAKLRGEALKAARAASDKAHAEWAESKAGADPMRKRGERVKVAAVHVPGER